MNYKYKLQNLDCANCAQKIENQLKNNNKLQSVNVNFATCKLSFYSDKVVKKEEIQEIITKIEPEVKIVEENVVKKENSLKEILRLLIGISFYGIGVLIPIAEVKILFIIASIIILLAKTAKRGWKQIVKSKKLDENILITISVIGAILVGKSTEGIMVILLYEIGKILEARAINKTRKSITDLMNIKPEYANLKTEKEIKRVNPEEVKIGDIIIVKQGEKIPIDGEIIKGEAELNNAALTGESQLIMAKSGDKVLSGSVISQGLIEIRAMKNYQNSTVSRILELVENATDKKAKTETFVSKAAKIYTPVVLILAILVAIGIPIFFANVTYQESIYKALIFLVISCPCSIAISVPLAYFTGIGKASKRGILIKGSDYLDGLKDIKEVIFDKTGTITTGNFKIENIESYDEKMSEDDILNYFIMGESFSNHPIAKSIVNQAKRKISLEDVNNFEEITGKGIQYEYKGKKIKIGNKNFLNIQTEEEKNKLYLQIQDQIKGYILLKDEIKQGVKETITNLEKRNIKTKIFTGDKKEQATQIAKELEVNEVKYEMLPEDKYTEVEKIIQERAKQDKIAFVGDGINDSPVLARADIGISMGGIGSSSAIEASDVVIMKDELTKIIEAIDISKKTNYIIKENLIFSIGVKILILFLSLLGVADMWQAIFADVGTTLITIFNTIRILK